MHFPVNNFFSNFTLQTRELLELSAAALSCPEVFIAATATSRMARQFYNP
jgi:hypothetical protein